MTVQRASGVMRRWVLACAGAETIGMSASAAASVIAFQAIGQLAEPTAGGGEPPQWLLVLGGAGLGLVIGPLLGAAQMLGIIGVAVHPWRWVLANLTAWIPAMAIIFTERRRRPCCGTGGRSCSSGRWPVRRRVRCSDSCSGGGRPGWVQ